MIPVARYITRHVAPGDNTNLYSPTFTDGSGHGTVGGSIGTWSPTYFAVHNPASTAVTATVWTVDQGTSGTGAQIYLPGGSTVYVNVAKIVPTTSVELTLFGTLSAPMVY
jgi:hypothetical protein